MAFDRWQNNSSPPLNRRDDSLVPKAYFRIAQIFHDRLMNKDQAQKVLGLLLKKFPDHEIVPQAESFLARL